MKATAMEIDPLRLPGFLRGLALLLAVPAAVAALVLAAHVAQVTAPRRPGDPAPMTDADATPQRMIVQEAAVESMKRAAVHTTNATRSRVVRFSSRSAVLVLTPRPHPYGVRALRRFPQAAKMLSDKRLLVRLPIVVKPGARLILHSRHVRELLMSSAPHDFASIVGLGGKIRLTGTTHQPLKVISFEPHTKSR